MTTASTIDQLVPSRPTGSELGSTSDDYHREVRRAIKNTFPNLVGTTNVTVADLLELINATADVVNDAIVKRTNAGTILGTITGNAGSASRLQTARNIAGVSFDGSQDINLGINNLDGVSGLTATDITRLAGLAALLRNETLAARLITLSTEIATIPQANTDLTTNTAEGEYVTPAVLNAALGLIRGLTADPRNAGDRVYIGNDGRLDPRDSSTGVESGIGSQTVTLIANYRVYDFITYSIISNSGRDSADNRAGLIPIEALQGVTTIGGGVSVGTRNNSNTGYLIRFNETNRTLTLDEEGVPTARWLTVRMYRG